MDVMCSLKGSTASTIGGMVCTLASPRISANSPKSGDKVCCGNSVSVHPYVYTQQLKVLKHLICIKWMWKQLERLYSLNHSVVSEIEALVPDVKKLFW
jgi:hypothetical protein